MDSIFVSENGSVSVQISVRLAFGCLIINARVPEYLPTSTSTITLELTSTSKVRVPGIQY